MSGLFSVFRQNSIVFLRSIINSYTQIFFNQNIIFGIFLLIVSFFDVVAGICGLLSVVLANSFAYFIGFNRINLNAGLYGFNALLVGLGIGIYYELSATLLVFLFFTSILSLFLTVSFEGWFGKYQLPYLSLPFVIVMWFITLASREFSALPISERGVYMLNQMYDLGGESLMNAYIFMGNLDLPQPIVLYFKSLAAIFFQYYLFAGFIVAIGLLIYSRIAFIFSILGFFTAYLFYQIMGIDIYQLSHHYIGFNYILTAIAIGSFFIIPSKNSIFWTMILIPLTTIFIIAFTALLEIWQLSVYSLPFNIIVILFLYALKHRVFNLRYPELTIYQYNSPEINLYMHANYATRFGNQQYFPIYLPFFGDWTISQGHNGKYTHLEDWRYAWDFVITDEEKKTYSWLGREKEDFYCYNKPILAPADGIVEIIEDNVEDNLIGDVNTERNWGNTIIIKHTNFLYSKISHIKKKSFKVNVGDYVKKGSVIAFCGNSGRSPEPHVHFQLQSFPHIGSKTLLYPIAHYLRKVGNNYLLQSYKIPKEDEIVTNVQINQLIRNAFHFIPGQKITIVTPENQKIVWEVITDAWNQTYIYCSKTNAKAYFFSDGVLHYFTNYIGKKNTYLYYFFLGSFKILFGLYHNTKVHDKLPLHLICKSALILLQDIVAPFFMFLQAKYHSHTIGIEDNFNIQQIKIFSTINLQFIQKTIKTIDFEFEISNRGIEQFVIKTNNLETKLICEHVL